MSLSVEALLGAWAIMVGCRIECKLSMPTPVGHFEGPGHFDNVNLEFCRSCWQRDRCGKGDLVTRLWRRTSQERQGQRLISPPNPGTQSSRTLRVQLGALLPGIVFGMCFVWRAGFQAGGTRKFTLVENTFVGP